MKTLILIIVLFVFAAVVVPAYANCIIVNGVKYCSQAQPVQQPVVYVSAPQVVYVQPQYVPVQQPVVYIPAPVYYYPPVVFGIGFGHRGRR